MLKRVVLFALLAGATSFVPRIAAQTQEKTFTNRLPVYVGDVINESNATIDSDHAAILCARLSMAVNSLHVADNSGNKAQKEDKKSAEEHSRNCIFHIVRFADYSPTASAGSEASTATTGKAQTTEADNWYAYSNDHVWSKEDLGSAKRLFGAKHVGVYFILLNRAMDSADVTAVKIASKKLTAIANNNFQQNQIVRLSGFAKGTTFLNGKALKITSATPSEFTADFDHDDYSLPSASGNASDSSIGKAKVAESVPTTGPTPDASLPSTFSGSDPASCPDKVALLPKLGADGYYASYTVDAKRKISANIQHLFYLLGAAGLSGAEQISYEPAPVVSTSPMLDRYRGLVAKVRRRSGLQREQLSQGKHANVTQILLGADPNVTDTPSCYAPDAVFGGGIVDVAYQPSDMTLTASLVTGEGAAMSTVDLGKNKTYTLDNEGRYWFDLSVPITLKKLSEVQYQNAGGTFAPVNVDSTNTFMALDLFFPQVDVKTNNWTKYPHPLVGVGFAKQPLSRILVAGAWGPYFSELYIGAAFVKQPRIASGSNSCSAGTGATTDTPNSFGYHYCTQVSIGLNLTVTGIASKLGSPK